MNQTIRLFVAAALAAGAVSCGKSLVPDIEFPEDYAWFSDSALGYRIAYPAHWQKEKDPPLTEAPDVVWGGASFTTVLHDSLEAHLWITVLGPTDDFRRFVEEGEAERVVVGGRRGYESKMYLWGNMNRTVVFPGSDRYFFVQCAADPEVFDGFDDIFDAIFESFEITGTGE